MKIPYDVQEQRCDVDQTVNTVQDPTMAGNGGAHVFDADIPLNHTDGQVSQLPTDADDQPCQDIVSRLEIREGEVEHPWQEQRHDQGTQRSLPGLVRADIAAELPPAHELATGIRRYIIQLH